MRDPPACNERLRPVRCIDIVELVGFRLKLVTIVASGDQAGPDLTAGAICVAERHLREHPTRHEHYGVGFLGVHDGQGSNQVFLDLWINSNELKHTIWISSKDKPGELVVPPDDYNSVCVWDLAVQAFEREAWLRHVLRNSAGPDLDAYLAERIDAME
ncbi:MAG TPA: hypothetical protein VFF69_11795 [Phycisphaerales bacterium]|nr:hypothetical protein [Phycisphaerales bacterium]